MQKLQPRKKRKISDKWVSEGKELHNRENDKC